MRKFSLAAYFHLFQIVNFLLFLRFEKLLTQRLNEDNERKTKNEYA